MISIVQEPGSAPGVSAQIFEGMSMPAVSPSVLPVLMLFASNVFTTFAWYGHLKFEESWLPLAVLVSWGIAFFEYWLAVPANRWGSAVYSAAQLKTMQEVITLVVFAGFSVLYLKEPLGWNHGLGFALIAAGAFLIFHKMVVIPTSLPAGRANARPMIGGLQPYCRMAASADLLCLEFRDRLDSIGFRSGKADPVAGMQLV
jgi:uncharacterized protein